jgi:hypothetical protein
MAAFFWNVIASRELSGRRVRSAPSKPQRAISWPLPSTGAAFFHWLLLWPPVFFGSWSISARRDAALWNDIVHRMLLSIVPDIVGGL